MKRDFDFVSMLLEQFFKQPHIQKRFKLIECREITGWEIWLQIEFSVFLEGHIEVAEWEREFQYTIDRRIARDRKYMAIDFTIRKKQAGLGQFIAMEFKQNSNVRSCIKGMMEDTYKVSMVRSSENDLRSMWTVGVHPRVDESILLDIINEYTQGYAIHLLKNCFLSRHIKHTGLAYTLF